MPHRLAAALVLALLPPLAPTAHAQAFNISAEADSRKLAPLPVTFQAEVARETKLIWNFGDGSAEQTGARVQHVFYRPGTYTVQVAVMRGGQRVGRGNLQLRVGSQGPERAALVLLLGQGSVTFGHVGSVVYAPYTAQYTLNGQALRGNTAALARSGPQTASVRLTKAGGGSLSQSVSFAAPARGLQRSAAGEASVLGEVNRLRAAGYNCATGRFDGVRRARLSRQPLLDKAALAHALAMPTANFVDHISALDGSAPSDRIAAAGYSAQSTAENIAVGQPTPAEAVAGWLDSPSHCAALMGDYAQTGLAYVQAPQARQAQSSEYGHYWVQVFATPQR